MANSLLAHLYSRIRGSQEDIATVSLQYLLAQSAELNHAFTKLLTRALHTELEDTLQYACQSSGEDRERPDLSGTDAAGREVLLCEMKFYAGLTENQPCAYLERLRKERGCGLVFVCPKARQTSLWAKLSERCGAKQAEVVDDFCVCVDGATMACVTWAEVLERLRSVAAATAVEYLSDIGQLAGYCAQMDSDAFLPFRAEDLTAEVAKKAERYYDVVDETAELLCGDKSHKTSKKGLKATAFRRGYTRCLYLDDFSVSLNYSREWWRSSGSEETPFWVSIRDRDWKETENFKRVLAAIPAEKKEDAGYATYLALMPPIDATFDEVCAALKRQVLRYADLFCAAQDRTCPET